MTVVVWVVVEDELVKSVKVPQLLSTYLVPIFLPSCLPALNFGLIFEILNVFPESIGCC